MADVRRQAVSAFEPVIRRIGERTGLVFPPTVRPSVEARIRDEMARRSIATLDGYLALLEADPAAFARLAESLTIGETYFFREPAQLSYLRGRVIPELLGARSDDGPLRVWSAGCATGEEAYTIAILLHEMGLAASARVVGTDLSAERIAIARAGVYSRWSLRGVPERVVQRYFRKRGDRYHLDPAIRGSATFRVLNLAEERVAAVFGGPPADVIFCRNVLIYLDAPTVGRVARALMSALGANGWLFLGASDPPLAGLLPCEVVMTGSGIAYRRPRDRPSRPDARSEIPAAPPRPAAPARPADPEPEEAPAPADEDATEAERLYAARDYRGAAERAARCVQTDDAPERSWVVLVRALANQGAMNEAGTACIAGLERHPVSAELLYLHAVILVSARRDRDAAAALRRALYVDRALAPAHLLLGDVMSRMGNRAEAERAFRNAERILSSLAGDRVVPGTDGEHAGRLARAARHKLASVQDAS